MFLESQADHNDLYHEAFIGRKILVLKRGAFHAVAVVDVSGGQVVTKAVGKRKNEGAVADGALNSGDIGKENWFPPYPCVQHDASYHELSHCGCVGAARTDAKAAENGLEGAGEQDSRASAVGRRRRRSCSVRAEVCCCR